MATLTSKSLSCCRLKRLSSSLGCLINCSKNGWTLRKNQWFLHNGVPLLFGEERMKWNISFIVNLVNDMWNCNHSGVITGTSWAESLLSSFRAYLEPVSPQWQYQEDSRETSFLTLSPSWGLTLCYNAQSNVPWKIMLWSGSQMLVRISCYPLFGLKHLGSSLGPTRCFPLETEAWINVLCLWIKHLCSRFKTFLTVLALKMHSLNFFSAPCCHSSCVWCFLAAFFVSFSDFFCYCFLEIPNNS